MLSASGSSNTFAARFAIAFIENQLGLGALASSTAEMLLPAAATLAVQSLAVYLRARDANLIGYQLG